MFVTDGKPCDLQGGSGVVEGIEFRSFQHSNGRLHIAVRRNGTNEKKDVIGGGSSREVAHGDLAFVAGRQDEVLASFAGVRSGKAHVHDVPLVQVVDDAHKRAWGQFNDHRAVRQIDVGPFVWRVRVRSEDELFWTAFEDEELIVSRET